MFTRLLFLALFYLIPISSNASNRNETQYYITLFASQGIPNRAVESHTFATFVGVYNGKIKRKITISWMPSLDYLGINNTMPYQTTVPGSNYTLEETLRMKEKSITTYWGPYEIGESFFEDAKKRAKYLDSGGVKYKMILNFHDSKRMPALENKPGAVINCAISVSDLGGYLETMADWGNSVTLKIRDFFGLPGNQKANHQIAVLMNLQNYPSVYDGN